MTNNNDNSHSSKTHRHLEVKPAKLERFSSSMSLGSDDSGTGLHAALVTDQLQSSSSNLKSMESSGGNDSGEPLPPPVLVYHSSARSIVFRDHLRRAATATESPTNFEIPSESTDAAVRAHQLRQQDLQKLQASVAASTDNNRNNDSSQPKKMSKLETITLFASDLLDQSDTVAPSEAGIPEKQIAGFQPRVVALPKLGLGPDDVYEKLLQSPSNPPHPDHADDWTPAEREVVEMLR